MRPGSRSNIQLSNTWWIITLLVLTGVSVAWMLIQNGTETDGRVILLPVLAGAIILIWLKPQVGFWMFFQYAFLSICLGRYFSSLFVLMDALLFLTTLSALFKIKKEQVSSLKSPLFLLLLIWFCITLLGKLFLDTLHFSHWASETKGILFYGLQLIPLSFLLFQRRELLQFFITSIIFWGILSTVFAGVQGYLGQDGIGGMGTQTGIISPFTFQAQSIFSDAEQFGLIVSLSGILCMVMGIEENQGASKTRFFIGLSVCLLGVMFSGGMLPWFVFLSGLYFYSLFSGKWPVFIALNFFALIAFVFLRYTDFGNTYDLIYAFRLLLDQQGTAALSNSGYDQIWIEYGYIGLILFSGAHIYVLFYAIRKLFQNKTDDCHSKYFAVLTGYISILLSGFYYSFLGSVPLGIILLLGMAMLVFPEKMNRRDAKPLSTPAF